MRPGDEPAASFRSRKTPLISAKTDMLWEGPNLSSRSIMRIVISAAIAALLGLVPLSAARPRQARRPPSCPGSAQATPAPNGTAIRIDWEVKNRFRLFSNEADFQRHVAASRGDGVLAAEQRLARASDGRGWARDMVDNLCVDQTGRLPETCQRDGEKENYLCASRSSDRGRARRARVPPGALCALDVR